MQKIVECVPNFSEGRDMSIIQQITAEIEKVSDVMLLDVDAGRDTNRTVVTFAGTPEAVENAAFLAIKKASELIDMSKHSGTHPRMGATDVCPFIPVSGVTMDECVEISKQVGKRVATELGIPVFLYGYSATKPERVKLPDIREGEYEALSQKIKTIHFKPDFGDAVFNPKSGATVIGARDFLIAYNININSRSVKIANDIAKRVRESGYTIISKETGEKKIFPGTCKTVQGVGWYIPEYQMAQMSYNILDYRTTPISTVFDESIKYANEFGVRVTGSELIGLIPLSAILTAGKHFLQKQNMNTGVSEHELVRIAAQSLGLSELSPFDADKKIIEYRLRKRGKLVSMSVHGFIDELASDSPAPGGGSVAALCGALSAGLSGMVGHLTYNKKDYANVRNDMITTSEKAQKLKDFFIEAIDRDTEAFNSIMTCFSMPKTTDDEKKRRSHAIQEATKQATRIPFSVLEKTLETAKLALFVTEKGNKNSLSDAGVAGLTALAAAEGAFYNVMINLQSIEDVSFKTKMNTNALTILHDVQKISADIHTYLGSKFIA